MILLDDFFSAHLFSIGAETCDRNVQDIVHMPYEYDRKCVHAFKHIDVSAKKQTQNADFKDFNISGV